MSNYPDDFRGTNMDDPEPEDTRNEDEVIENRIESRLALKAKCRDIEARIREANIAEAVKQGLL